MLFYFPTLNYDVILNKLNELSDKRKLNERASYINRSRVMNPLNKVRR
jgi:hypothetical protein